MDRIEGKIGGMETKLADIPNRAYMWLVFGALLAAYASGLAALAVLK